MQIHCRSCAGQPVPEKEFSGNSLATSEDTRQCAAERGEAKGEVKGDTFPVVQGTPIGVPVGAPQIPMGVVVAVSSLTVEVGVPVGAPQMPMLAVSPLKVKEQEVLNYRAAVLLLSGLDIAATLLKTAALLASTRNLVWLALALFILGPLSGMVGAKTLNHNLVSVYFAFCGLKIAAEIAFAINVWEWNVLFVVMQVWIIKIVAAFLSALERISPERRSELLDLKDVAVHRVYW